MFTPWQQCYSQDRISFLIVEKLGLKEGGLRCRFFSETIANKLLSKLIHYYLAPLNHMEHSLPKTTYKKILIKTLQTFRWIKAVKLNSLHWNKREKQSFQQEEQQMKPGQGPESFILVWGTWSVSAWVWLLQHFWPSAACFHGLSWDVVSQFPFQSP